MHQLKSEEPPAADLIWNPLPYRPDVQCAHSTPISTQLQYTGQQSLSGWVKWEPFLMTRLKSHKKKKEAVFRCKLDKSLQTAIDCDKTLNLVAFYKT